MFSRRIYRGKVNNFLSCEYLLVRRLSHTEQFVPQYNFQPDRNVLSRVREFIERNYNLFVVTGAGISTESGIRDYRSEGVGLYAVSDSRPVKHQQFLASALCRQRYWARNYVGWPAFSSHQPNGGHYALAELERVGKVHWTVTQNVDSLHSKAGSKRLTELHGSSSRYQAVKQKHADLRSSVLVICLNCGTTTRRDDLQGKLKELNPTWYASPDVSAPDGDVFLSNDLANDFQMPDCRNCGGILKPDVVFFGDNVPTDRVKLVQKRLQESDAVLVLGSSLQVYSAYRFMVAAHEQRKPLAIVNIGPTRADDLASLKVEAKIGEIVHILYNCTD